MKYIFSLSIFSLLLFLEGCAQKISIKTVEPAKVDRVALTKVISVAPFKNDNYALSSKIEAKLANISFDGKNYFTLVSREDLDKILKEQKLQNSGLLQKKYALEVGNLVGAQAIVSGAVSQLHSSDTHFYETRAQCADRKCKKLFYIPVRCTRRDASLNAQLHITDVEKGDLIYADTITKSASYKHCLDDSRSIPSKGSIAESLANNIANSFTFDLSPHYKTFSVTLLDDPDIDYTDEEEDLLEFSIEYIKAQRYDKAEQLLTQLIDLTHEKSYVAFYNLGIVKEAQGDYIEAKELYERADKLMLKPIEEIILAYKRINALIYKRQRVFQQLKGRK